DGADGSAGGNGLGGGVYNVATSSLRLERSTVAGNHADGGDGGAGGSDGEGIGGGVYHLGGLDFDVFTLSSRNHASTNHDDISDLSGEGEADEVRQRRKNGPRWPNQQADPSAGPKRSPQPRGPPQKASRKKKRPAGSFPPSNPPPARHRPGARSARRPRCPA